MRTFLAKILSDVGPCKARVLLNQKTPLVGISNVSFCKKKRENWSSNFMINSRSTMVLLRNFIDVLFNTLRMFD